jgi:hexosaminidase
MKKILLLTTAVWITFCTAAQSSSTAGLSLIPEPVSILKNSGLFTLPAAVTLVTNGSADLSSIAKGLAARITTATGYKVMIQGAGKILPKNAIHLSIVADASIPKEGYRLKVTPTGISLAATEPAGIFYGVQTLMQLFPKEIEAASKTTAKWIIPAVTIQDHPRFGWRGLMLDVSRHFFTKEEVKRYIDDMVKYKFNLLHWHLTDDQGWRIEIKSLPKLTSVGAWRVEKTGSFNVFSAPTADEPRNYGGFYTQEDIKEVVQYAKERFVNILPEIDVPGHSLAALAAYPDLACTPGTYTVNSGEPFMIWPASGHFYGLVDNSLCPANEKVYDFLDKVFTEVAQLFPFSYIHMGGDETARNFWEKSEQVKALMQKENLKDLDEVQSYFVKRVEKIIASKGKKTIGWDEILQGGLAPNAAVMSWRGMKGGIEAARLGHEVVMSPTTFAYIDYMQSDRIMEPPVYASLRLKKSYEFEPIPDSINPALIKGGQANLWTEQIYNYRQVQYMTWPRAFAIAEILWSPKKQKNWPGFVSRVENHFDRFTVAKKKYSPAIYDADFKVTKKDTTAVLVELIPEIEGLQLHYSFDNSYPDEFYPIYKTPLQVPKDAVLMRVISYRNGKPIGRMMNMPVTELKKRVGINQ